MSADTEISTLLEDKNGPYQRRGNYKRRGYYQGSGNFQERGHVYGRGNFQKNYERKKNCTRFVIIIT